MNARDFFHRLKDAICGGASPVMLPEVPAGMSRRRFLGFLTAATATAATLDLDALVWSPGAKTIFIPPVAPIEIVEVFHGQHLGVTPDWLAREALKVLKRNLSFANYVTREYDVSPRRVGDTLQIRTPQRFEVRKGNALWEQPITEHLKNVTLTDQLAVNLSSEEIAHCRTLDDVRSQVIEPAARSMAQAAQQKGLNVFSDLILPTGGCEAAICRQDGLSVRAVKAYDFSSDHQLIRLDLLGGKA